MTTLLERSVELINREARYLDRQQWQEWLDLYEPDSWFWVPAWDEDGRPTDDPRSQISLLFYDQKLGIEERIARIRSGRSSASLPLPRTCHLVTGILIDGHEGDLVRVASSFTVHSYRRGGTSTFYGAYEHELRDRGDRLTIAKKKILLLNDAIPSVVDIYGI